MDPVVQILELLEQLVNTDIDWYRSLYRLNKKFSQIGNRTKFRTYHFRPNDKDSDDPSIRGMHEFYLLPNGKKDGPDKWQYKSGKRMVEQTMKNGAVEGLSIYWYESGQIAQETMWDKGVIKIQRTWWRNNNIQEITQNGKTISWCINGIKK